ncbi:hypothetical protein OQX63_17265 [Pedobacter sp. PF22-3]|uniref:JAB domain-containing protein n=1 Tax=Pedobacter sp. PF22-3 TaxID=2994467 RepID=UPI0022459747|nr:JAB domain-containing protein [Pedobacter sp. PF22-3]MCX2495243.1 hypothetical protein [Pedobacter sp. PF22-3]
MAMFIDDRTSGEFSMATKKRLSQEERRLRNRYKIQQVEHPKEIDSLSDVFVTFKQNWSHPIMDWVQGYKTTVLDSDNKPICNIYFEPNAPLRDEHIKMLFTIILENFSDAKSVMIARNHAGKAMEPDQTEKETASKFKNYGQSIGLPVADQFVVSPLGMYKFKEQDYATLTNAGKQNDKFVAF